MFEYDTRDEVPYPEWMERDGYPYEWDGDRYEPAVECEEVD